MVRIALVGLVSSGLVLAPHAALPIAYAQPGSTTADEAIARLDTLMADVRDLYDRIERRWFDVDALATELASEDPAGIVAWVHENVAYHPYEGVLRGATGTLIARAGNSFDQALLTSRLLSDAGFDVRFAVAAIDETLRHDLLATTRAAPGSGTTGDVQTDAPTSSLGIGEDAIARAAAEVAAEYADLVTTYELRSAHLRGLLADFDVPIASEPERAFEGETQYAWVQYRSGLADAWRSAHPVFGQNAQWAERVLPDDTFDTIPEAIRHRLRVRVLVEQRRGSELEEKALMDPWERSVAELFGRAISYTTVPADVPESMSLDADLRSIFASSSHYLPLLDDALPAGAQRFDVHGTTGPAELSATDAPDVGQSEGGALGGALSVIGGNDEVLALTAQWLEFTLIEPSGRERTYRRAVFDRIGAANRAKGLVDFRDEVAADDAAVIEGLQATHTFMVNPGAYSSGYVELRTLEHLLASHEYLHTLIRAAAGEPVADVTPPATAVQALRAMPHFRQFLVFDAAPTVEGVVSYRSAPTMSVISRTWDGGAELSDILQSERTSLRVDESGPRLARMPNLEHGIWETVSERVALRGGGETFDAASYMAAADQHGIDWIVVAPGDGATVADLPLPPEARAAMIRDLDNGNVVATPMAMPPGMTHAAWWRVDPETGLTLGRGMDGRGAAQVEHATATSLMLSAILGFEGMLACAMAGGGAACCVADGLIAFAIGLTLTTVLSGALVSLAVATKDTASLIALGVGAGLDIAGAAGGAIGVLPSTCNLGGSTRPTKPALAASGGPRSGECGLRGIAVEYWGSPASS